MTARALILFLLSVLTAFGQNTARFPATTAGWQDLLVARDAPNRSVLTEAIDSTTLSIPVLDGTQFTGNSVVTLADTGEQVLICSITANTLNACVGGRGFGGSTAAAHGIGVGVLGNVVAWHHNQLAAEVKAIEDSLGPNLSKVNATATWDSITGKPTTFVFSDGSYTDPAWLTITKAKVGLGSVENTALSAWSGSANITTVGTLAAGTVPWARLSNIPTTFSPSAHTHPVTDLSTVGDYSSKITSGTYSINVTGFAGSVAWTNVSGRPTAVSQFTNDSGFQTSSGSVNNATSAGSANAVAFTNVTGKPFGLANMLDSAQAASGAWALEWKNFANHQIVDMSASTAPNGTSHNATNAEVAWTASAGYPTLMGWNGTSTYGVRVDSARVADGVPWSGVTGKGSGDGTRLTVSQLGCGSNYNSSCDPGGNGQIDYSDSSGYATSAGNADTVDSLHIHTGRNTEANKIVRTDGNGYIQAGWINTDSGDNGTTAISRVYASQDGYIRYYSLGEFSRQVFNARTLDASWMWQDDYLALPTGVVQWGVFTPRAANATITGVTCWSDTSDAVINLRRSDGGDMINGNLTCNGGGTTNLNGYNAITVGFYVGMWEVSGTAKSIRVGITYTVAY